jgi:hypothetical protein
LKNSCSLLDARSSGKSRREMLRVRIASLSSPRHSGSALWLSRATLNSVAYVSADALLFPVMHRGGNLNVGRLSAGDRCNSVVSHEPDTERSVDQKLVRHSSAGGVLVPKPSKNNGDLESVCKPRFAIGVCQGTTSVVPKKSHNVGL